MSEPVRKLGHVDDADACPFSVGVDHDLVTVWPNSTSHAPRAMTMRLDAAGREHFQRLFMQAERDAEAWAREHGAPAAGDVIEAGIWCGYSAECANGPGDHQWLVSCYPRIGTTGDG